jgi:3',5'-cyclic AMP phosphodiesterase CpdA
MVVAQLTDLHLLERTERHALAARFVSLGRRLDAEDRLEKARSSILAAKAAGAQHFVFTGDLTETGTQAQFEVLAELLFACRLHPDDVTLLPGNHDAYTTPTGWRDALEGPLRAFARNAATEPGKVVAREGLWILPVDCTFHQPVTRSAGRFDAETEEALQARLDDPACPSAVLIAIHHPPQPRPGPWHWVDGLLGCKRLLAMIESRANVTVLHGHLHKQLDRMHGHARVMGAGAVVDGAAASLLDVGAPAAAAVVA